MTIRTTIRLPDELMRQVKQKAASEGRTLTSFVEDALREAVGRKPGATKRVLPRISDQAGPPLPGVDISNNAALQEMDDLEYIERLKRGFR